MCWKYKFKWQKQTICLKLDAVISFHFLRASQRRTKANEEKFEKERNCKYFLCLVHSIDLLATHATNFTCFLARMYLFPWFMHFLAKWQKIFELLQHSNLLHEFKLHFHFVNIAHWIVNKRIMKNGKRKSLQKKSNFFSFSAVHNEH